MSFNEDSRVKIPTLLHLCRLGYTYLSLKDANWDQESNIFTDIFDESIQRINSDVREDEITRLFADLKLDLDNEDLGKAFYTRLIARSGIRLIDFEDFDNNSFHVVTELPYENDDESFRPDIILLINGMPLGFIEVKIPNNREGILAERNRMVRRFENKKFRKLLNLTQLMVFSNNMEYDDGDIEPLQGAFYATTAYGKPGFNYFREDDPAFTRQALPELEDAIENLVLKDNNLSSIKSAEEFKVNKNPNKPTNRICTSLFSRERLAFLVRYAIAYVDEETGLQKHIMRYPQFFASSAIATKLDEGIKKGIIWHTQGSGKTALAFYNVHHLTDYFQKKNIIPKFYFIVDRIDLLTQAAQEFEARGLKVHRINSRDEFAKEIKSSLAIHNDTGRREITVVNIQKFKDDPAVVSNSDYSLNMQRVYFLDEVHRSYNPKGSFLANLETSDPNAIKIGLTGTPLISGDVKSKALFGNYIHKYYYNASIKDGYTLRLIREEIQTDFAHKLKEQLSLLEKTNILKGEGDKKMVYAHPNFVEPMLDYIVQDFEQARIQFDDNSIGAMVVCDSSEQAKKLYEIFQEKYAKMPLSHAAEEQEEYRAKKKYQRAVKTAALILHDAGTKQERKDEVDAFKAGKIDILFVYNMLLTGFDAKRLKKLYLARLVKAHNLLQTLTRVNRTYKDFRFGYVVDFADIQKEFDKTNRAYFDELQEELGDDLQHYSDLFLKPEEIESRVKHIEKVLFPFDTINKEIFSDQISEISDRSTMLEIVKALNESKSLYNLIRLTGNFDLLEKLDFRKLASLSRMADARLGLINQKQALETGTETANLLNVALEDILFAFTKVSEEELVLADQLKESLRRTREALANNLDKGSPEFISLRAELERLFKKKNLNEVSKEEMEANMAALKKIYEKAKEDDRKNRLLKAKYDNDAKYARIHKRLMEKGEPTDDEIKLLKALKDLKAATDDYVLHNSHTLSNEAYIERMVMKKIIEEFKKKNQIHLNAENTRLINKLVVQEYLGEYRGSAA
ncbi:type I restriction endonuclease subunit R [Owenweeksia hongkongensis]|uniref:type I restriction endonuclease subunit R n=1 Tax=Owenweeksia hongkongensis TaxID=253245 RepID=UPI003A9439F1